MSTFESIDGAGDVGWYWHLVEAELRARGHGAVAPTFPQTTTRWGWTTTPTRWSRPSAIAETWSW